MTKKNISIEVIPSFDWVRNYTFFSVYVVNKSNFQRYDAGKANTEKEGYIKANEWIANNL